MNPVVIVGGGPAGLMAAEVISAAGVPVCLYERMPSVGRKLLMAGRGGLNLTHGEPLARLLERYGEAAPVIGPLIEAFPPTALVAWARGLGQETFQGGSGRIFPKAMKASPLLRAWLARLAAQGVEIRTGHRWLGLDEAGCALFETADGAVVAAAPAPIVLALGGGSWPRLGTDGSWTQPIARLAIACRPLSAANAGVRIAWSEHLSARFAGQPLKRIRVTVDGASARGEAVITARGLEGGAIYALVPTIRDRLRADGRAVLGIDLRPDLDAAALSARLGRPRLKQSTATWLRKSAQLAPAEIALMRESARGPLPTEAAGLARLVKSLAFEVEGLAGLDRAISSAGGIRLDQLGPDLEIRSRPGLFAAGEMLDWEAPTGGYLLQACFSTGHAAGRGVLRRLGRPQ